jgi:hypothetical protein
MVKEGELQLDTEDEIMRDTLVTRDGQVVHERIRSLEPDNLLSELLQR